MCLTYALNFYLEYICIYLYIRHGDMLYLLPTDGKDLGSNLLQADNMAPSPGSSAPGVVEDEVDQILDKEDGKIYRKRNEQL